MLGAMLYGVLYVDPPRDFLVYSRETGMDRHAANHYPVMSLDQLSALKPPAAKDCALYLWGDRRPLPQCDADRALGVLRIGPVRARLTVGQPPVVDAARLELDGSLIARLEGERQRVAATRGELHRHIDDMRVVAIHPGVIRLTPLPLDQWLDDDRLLAGVVRDDLAGQ